MSIMYVATHSRVKTILEGRAGISEANVIFNTFPLILIFTEFRFSILAAPFFVFFVSYVSSDSLRIYVRHLNYWKNLYTFQKAVSYQYIQMMAEIHRSRVNEVYIWQSIQNFLGATRKSTASPMTREYFTFSDFSGREIPARRGFYLGLYKHRFFCTTYIALFFVSLVVRAWTSCL